ncbi:MAG: hypothetical protein ACT4N5_08250 [Nitrosopumilaceae archaeon]
MISFFASILLISAGQVPLIFAAEPEIVTDAAGGLSLKTVFHFIEGDESIGTFKVFGTEGSGFTKNRALSFKLEGIIGYDRPLLYQAINHYFEYGMNSKTQYSEFDVDIIFSRGAEPYRSITYGDCQVKSYDVLTLTDAEEGYSGATKFAYIDSIRFDCRGFAPHNPVYEKFMEAKTQRATDAALKNLNHDKEITKQKEEMVAKYTLSPQLSQDFSPKESMPSWVRQAANWAETEKISMQEYQNLIRYLVAQGIM